MTLRRWNLLSLVLWSVAGVLFCATTPPVAQPPHNRRILDVQLLTFPGEYRVNIRLDDLTPFEIDPPRPGRPLRLRLAQTDIEPSVLARTRSNDLIERVWATPSDGGVTVLEFALATSQVEATHHEIAKPEPTIVVVLKLRPGVLLPSRVQWSTPKPASGTGFQPVIGQDAHAADHRQDSRATAKPSTSSETLHAMLPPPGSGSEKKISPALPRVGPLAEETSQLEPRSPAQGPPPRAMAPSGPTSPPASGPNPVLAEALREFDFFPVDRLLLDFAGSAELVQLYKKKQHEEALNLGLPFLKVQQSRLSLASLLFLLAECRHQLAVTRSAQVSNVSPDWASALNYYRQAQRFAPDSPFDGIADLRIAQCDGRLGRNEEKLAVLATLKRKTGLPNMPEILLESGRLALDMFVRSPTDHRRLEEAQRDFDRYVGEFPDHREHAEGLFLLGESRYYGGDYAGAYQAMLEGIQHLAGQETRIRREVLAHFALAAHDQGKVDLAHPGAEGNAPGMLVAVKSSTDPAVHMRYAEILEAAGDRAGAAAQYDEIIRDPMILAKPERLAEAKIRLTRFALDDERARRSDPDIGAEEYRHPVETLRAIYDDTYTLAGRAEILRDIVRHLRAQNRPYEVVRTAAPHLVRGDYAPEEIARELRQSVWDVMADVMERFRDRGEYLMALQAFETLGPYVADHPRRVPILLSCADVFLEAGMREQAKRVLERVLEGTSFASLKPGEQTHYLQMKRELSLDPARPDAFKKDAQALLAPEVNNRARARVLRGLGGVWATEGKHSYAAQVYLEGALYPDLPWAGRLEFYSLAAQEYMQDSVYTKGIAVLWQGMRDFEESGAPAGEGEKGMGALLMLLGQSLLEAGDYEKAAQAFEQYIDRFPQEDEAAPARYLLAKCYEKMGQGARATSQYEKLARLTPSEPFWGKLARQVGDQLRWEEGNPYMAQGVAVP